MNNLQSNLSKLSKRELTCEQFAQMCVAELQGFEYEFSKILDSFYFASDFEVKVMCVFSLCQILSKSCLQKCHKGFMKCLSQKLRFFLQDLTMNLISENTAFSIASKIQSLRQLKIFSDAYFQKLIFLCEKLKQNNQSFNYGTSTDQSSQFMIEKVGSKKYTKTTMLKINAVKADPTFNEIYQAYSILQKAQNSIWTNKVPDINSNDQEQAKVDPSQIRQTLKQLQETRQIYENTILLLHSTNLNLRQKMEKELSAYQEMLMAQIDFAEE